MKVHLGIKSDPIECRYSFDWLFGLMADHGLQRMQLGTFFLLYMVDDEWLRTLRAAAEKRGIWISSVFSSHRELSGFMSSHPLLEAATHREWEKLIHASSVLGAASAGTSAGAVMRDRPQDKEPGIQCYVRHMKDLTRLARDKGLKALTVEPMSSLWEFPSTAEENDRLMTEMDVFRKAEAGSRVPLYFCADISHGVADENRRVTADNWTLFEQQIPHMWEFHFKNTDAAFDSTFGFSAAENSRGIIDLARLRSMIDRNAHRFPAPEVTGYLEHPGPKLGRDYADGKLKGLLDSSIEALKAAFR